MCIKRILPVAATTWGLLLASLIFQSGCGGSSESAPTTVQEAPPLTPEQKKDWDKYYNKARSAAVNKKAR